MSVSCVKLRCGAAFQGSVELWAKAEAQFTGYQAKVCWDSGKGVVVTDVDGNTFIDWTSGVLVTNVGHSHPHLVEAVQAAAARLMNNYECLNEPRVQAAEKLVQILPAHLDRCFFLSTGSEATEACIRIMKRQTGKFEILSFHGGFHGRTYAALTRRRPSRPQEGLWPTLPEPFAFPSPTAIACPFRAKPETCDMLCPGLRGRRRARHSFGKSRWSDGGGLPGRLRIHLRPEGWFPRLEQWIRSRGLLFTLDEVQAGFGSTGKCSPWSGTSSHGSVALGKGIGSGMPASAVAARNDIIGVLGAGEMSSTKGGNPVACAAVVAVIEIFEREKLEENASASER